MIPSNAQRPRTHDLSDEEFAVLDDLLLQTPSPLEPVDAVMLDGFLCGVIVQPELLGMDRWLPHVFDVDARPLPDGTDPVWVQQVITLVQRRHAALQRALEENGWFDPLVLEMDEDAEAQAEAPAAENLEGASMHPPGQTIDAAQADDEDDPLAGLSPISRCLLPWVAGFQHATLAFPALTQSDDDAVHLAISRLFRHLPVPEGDEGEAEREILATLDKEHPLRSLDDGIEDMVMAVADLCDLTRSARYHVETIQRDGPKVGRNDPCPCGSGKKYKACHGAT